MRKFLDVGKGYLIFFTGKKHLFFIGKIYLCEFLSLMTIKKRENIFIFRVLIIKKTMDFLLDKGI